VTLDSDEQRKIVLSLIENATIKCGDGILERMYKLKESVLSAQVSIDDSEG